MLDKQLNIGDHIVDADGRIYVIEVVNKASYRAKIVNGGYFQETVPFNGMRREYGYVHEFFVCDDETMSIIASLRKENDRLKTELQEQKSDVERARTLKENLEWLSCTSLIKLEEKVERLDEEQGEEE